MSAYAWVTLATNDSYGLGALVLGHSLRQSETPHQLVVLVTPGVTQSMRDTLKSVFTEVKEVNILDSKDESNLKLLNRPELGVTFTKLHCWLLTQYQKCVFLDADTLVLENADELFEREELSAAPDVGWPDCFNSGVFVYTPSRETYNSLINFALAKGSFDGGDQGLLNMYFSDWAHKDINKHLPFIYNMCSTACYSYLPAFKQFGSNVKIVHFIAQTKPWLQIFDPETKQVKPSHDLTHLTGLLQHWWNIFCSVIHPQLSRDMGGFAGAFARLTLGEPRSQEQSVLEDQLRRQGWEIGNIDYMNKDAFGNIWSKICETLAATPQPETENEKSSEDASETEKKEQSIQAPQQPQDTVNLEKPITESTKAATLVTESGEKTPGTVSEPIATPIVSASVENLSDTVAMKPETPGAISTSVSETVAASVGEIPAKTPVTPDEKPTKIVTAPVIATESITKTAETTTVPVSELIATTLEGADIPVTKPVEQTQPVAKTQETAVPASESVTETPVSESIAKTLEGAAVTITDPIAQISTVPVEEPAIKTPETEVVPASEPVAKTSEKSVVPASESVTTTQETAAISVSEPVARTPEVAPVSVSEPVTQTPAVPASEAVAKTPTGADVSVAQTPVEPANETVSKTPETVAAPVIESVETTPGKIESHTELSLSSPVETSVEIKAEEKKEIVPESVVQQKVAEPVCPVPIPPSTEIKDPIAVAPTTEIIPSVTEQAKVEPKSDITVTEPSSKSDDKVLKPSTEAPVACPIAKSPSEVQKVVSESQTASTPTVPPEIQKVEKDAAPQLAQTSQDTATKKAESKPQKEKSGGKKSSKTKK